MTSANEDVSKGIIDRFRSLPIARSAVLGGRILADAVRLVATVVVILIVGVLLGFRFGGGPLAAVAGFLLIIAFGMALPGVSALIGLSVRNPETAQSAGFIWMFPLTFASSVFVAASTMPGWLQPFVRINPDQRHRRCPQGAAAGRPRARAGPQGDRLDSRLDRDLHAAGHPPIPPPELMPVLPSVQPAGG